MGVTSFLLLLLLLLLHFFLFCLLWLIAPDFYMQNKSGDFFSLFLSLCNLIYDWTKAAVDGTDASHGKLLLFEPKKMKLLIKWRNVPGKFFFFHFHFLLALFLPSFVVDIIISYWLLDHWLGRQFNLNRSNRRSKCYFSYKIRQVTFILSLVLSVFVAQLCYLL